MQIRQAQHADLPQINRIAVPDVSSTEQLSLRLAKQAIQGELYVAEFGERIVGISRLSRLTEDEWWLEGLRVHPDFQGQSVERDLYQYAIQRSTAHGTGTVRFAANARNGAVHKLAVETQFSQIGAYLLYQTNVLAAQDADFLPASALAPVRAFLAASPHYAHTQGCMEESTTWYALTDARLQDLIQQARVFTWHGIRHSLSTPDGVIISAITEPELFTLGYVDALVGHLADLCRAVRRFAAAQGFRKLQHRFLGRPERLVAIEQAGWRRPYPVDETLNLFSRPLEMNQNRLIDL